jgi:hypothetical protein
MALIPASWVLRAACHPMLRPHCAKLHARMGRAFAPSLRLLSLRILLPAPVSALSPPIETSSRLRMRSQPAYSAAPLPADRLLPSPFSSVPLTNAGCPTSRDFLWSLVEPMSFMRLSLKKAAHAALVRASCRKSGYLARVSRDMGIHQSQPLNF